MAKTKFHFLDDYRALVRDLIARHPLPVAMSMAVGGSYDALGEVEKQLLRTYGLEPHHTVVDVGCGSGRLAKALVPYLTQGRLLATDIVAELPGEMALVDLEVMHPLMDHAPGILQEVGFQVVHTLQ